MAGCHVLFARVPRHLAATTRPAHRLSLGPRHRTEADGGRNCRDGLPRSRHQIRRRAAGQDIGHALAGQLGHAGPRPMVALPIWGSRVVRGALSRRGLTCRLALEDVEPGAENGAGLEASTSASSSTTGPGRC